MHWNVNMSLFPVWQELLIEQYVCVTILKSLKQEKFLHVAKFYFIKPITNNCSCNKWCGYWHSCMCIAKTENQNAANTPWSPRWDWWVWRAPASKPKNGRFEKWPHPWVQWDVKNLTHFLELFQCMLCHPSHTWLHMADRPKSICDAY